MEKDIYDLSNNKSPVLHKGISLEQVVFSFTNQTFTFVTRYVKADNNCYEPIYKIVIAQNVLAPFLHFKDSEKPIQLFIQKLEGELYPLKENTK